jgi:hypothetical protein
METRFAHLKALVMNMASSMASQVKPTTLALGDSSTQGFNLRFFYATKFLGPLGLDEIESDIPNDHVLEVINDKTLIRVLTAAPITRASARVQKP